MGRDKAMIAYHGMPHYQYLAGLLEGLGIPPYLSARPDQIEKWKPTIPCIADQFEDKGPLGGILSAHLAQPEVAWLVVACDYAYLGERSLRQLVEARDVEVDLTAFVSPFDGGVEGLLGIWERGGMKEMKNVLEKNRLSVRKYLEILTFQLVIPFSLNELENLNSV